MSAPLLLDIPYDFSYSKNMDGVSPTPHQPQQKTNIFLIGVIIVVLLLFLILILNHFNILPLSNLFPSGTSQQTNNVTITPPSVSSSDQARRTLINSLPTVLAPSLLPPSSFEVELEPYKEGFQGSWITKDGGLRAIFETSSDSSKITSLELRYQKIEPASPSQELAQSEATALYKLEPKGTWVCNQVSTRRSYCENFWEEQDAKRGLGFQIDSLSDESARFIFSFCQYNKDSNYYSWKSCRSEFAQTGVQ